MTSFLALYRGDSVETAELVGVSADPDLIAPFAEELLRRQGTSESDDPVLASLQNGRRRALEAIRDEVEP